MAFADQHSGEEIRVLGKALDGVARQVWGEGQRAPERGVRMVEVGEAFFQAGVFGKSEAAKGSGSSSSPAAVRRRLSRSGSSAR